MIEVEEVSVRFGEKKVLESFSYCFKDCSVYSIIGRSGVGKSTLLRGIAGLQAIDGGRILCNGKEIKKPSKDIAMLHQNYANFPWLRCIDNVLMPVEVGRWITRASKEERCKAEELLNMVGLEGEEGKFPYQLSGGMRQRLALARILMQNPKVALMDEPLSALDPKTRLGMQELLIRFNKNSNNIIIMVTHDVGEAEKLASEKDNVITLGGE